MRASFSAVALAALVVFGTPSAASAAVIGTASPQPAAVAVTETVPDDDGSDGYMPGSPEEPTLAGSFAVGDCVRDVPWINFAVELTDPDSQVTTTAVTLVLSDGTNSVTIPLGQLAGNELSGRVLWPGATVDADGDPTGWPGWEFVDGEWRTTDGNFAWTRGDISAVISVNPEIAVPLSYPPASPVCVTGPRTAQAVAAAGGGSGLAATGGTTAQILPIAALGGVIVVGGAGLLMLRGRRRS